MGRARVLAASVLLALAADAASGWLAGGHREAVRGALRVLAGGAPELFAGAEATLADLAVDPDVFRNRATRELAETEGPEHYLDLERLPDLAWPEARAEHLESIHQRGLGISEVGALPYAIVEASQRLTLAFALLRRDGSDPAARAQALVWGGLLAHYAADAEQPLHTTVHHDGWALALGGSPLEGVHVRVDAVLERAPFDRAGALAGIEARTFADVARAVRAEIVASHALVDRAYSLPRLDAPGDFSRPEVVAFACERYAATARFVSSLWLTAWERSGTIELPGWARQTAKE